jgi:hypothetical protein
VVGRGHFRLRYYPPKEAHTMNVLEDTPRGRLLAALDEFARETAGTADRDLDVAVAYVIHDHDYDDDGDVQYRRTERFGLIAVYGAHGEWEQLPRSSGLSLLQRATFSFDRKTLGEIEQEA